MTPEMEILIEADFRLGKKCLQCGARWPDGHRAWKCRCGFVGIVYDPK